MEEVTVGGWSTVETSALSEGILLEVSKTRKRLLRDITMGMFEVEIVQLGQGEKYTQKAPR